MPNLRPLASALALATLSTVPALAGRLSPDLEQTLASLPAGKCQDVLVCLVEQVPVLERDRLWHEQNTPLAVRHKELVLELRATAALSQAGLVALLESAKNDPGLEEWTPLWLTNTLHVRADADWIRRLAARPEVDTVYPDLPVIPLEPEDRQPPLPDHDASRTVAGNLQAVRAPEAWALGYTGAGRLVCVIDTGVHGSHAALSGNWRGNVAPASECFYDPWTNVTTPFDFGTNGTKVAGVIAGLNPGTADTLGVAFGARWIAALGIRYNAYPDGSHLRGWHTHYALQSLQWAVDPDGDPGTMADVPDVINCSWGVYSLPGIPVCNALYWNAIDACEAAGSAVVFSVGTDSGYLFNPANRATTAWNSFSTGAVDVTVPANPVQIPDSPSGLTPCTSDPELQIKPEVVAPGYPVRTSRPGGTIDNAGITMAAAHVSGIIALMRQANPELDVISLKSILMDTATDLGASGEDTVYGHGMVNALACVQAALDSYGSASGTVASGGSPLPAAQVEVAGTGAVVACDAAGTYTIGVPVGPQTLVATCFGFEPDSQSVDLAGSGSATVHFDLEALPVALLSGLVEDNTSAPLANVRITVSGTPYETWTDGSGQYSFDVLDGQDWTVQAWKAGVGELAQVVSVSGPTVLDFVLAPQPNFQTTGPDSWGYRIFDINDAGGPEHNWSTIAGLGARVLPSGNAVVISPGFSFSYYGITYTTLAIHRNGYVCPGTTASMYEWDNFAIPSIANPNRMVAAYWDFVEPDLSGSVWGRYSAEHGGYVVEWDFMEEQTTYGPTGVIQLVLLDPALHPELGDDAAFLLHYHEILGQDFTVGIESTTGSTGVQYVYDDAYGPTATPLGNGSSLLITTAPAGFNSGCVVVQPPVILDDPLPDTPWTEGPWMVNADVQVDCDLFDALLEYRVNGAGWQSVTMVADDWTHVHAQIPGPLVPFDRVEYRITATPPSAPELAASTPIRSFSILQTTTVMQQDFADGPGDFQSTGEQSPFGYSTWEPGYDDFLCSEMVSDLPCYDSFHATLESAPLDCSTAPSVYLGYNYLQNARIVNCEGQTWFQAHLATLVSTDGGVVWEQVASHSLLATPDNSNRTVEGVAELDISALAALQGDVRIRFRASEQLDCCSSCVGQVQVYSVIGWTHLTISHDPITNQETLTWHPVGGIDSYRVYKADSPEGPWSFLTTVSGSSLVLPTESGTHLYQVRYALPE